MDLKIPCSTACNLALDHVLCKQEGLGTSLILFSSTRISVVTIIVTVYNILLYNTLPQHSTGSIRAECCLVGLDLWKDICPNSE